MSNKKNSYRDLLNTWRMYLERADFDIMLAQLKSKEKPLRQVYISCNYCGKSVSASMQGFSHERGQFQRASSSTPVKVIYIGLIVKVFFLALIRKRLFRTNDMNLLFVVAEFESDTCLGTSNSYYLTFIEYVIYI